MAVRSYSFNTLRCIKLQRYRRSSSRVAKHHADLHADLIDEITVVFDLLIIRQFPERLAHQSRLQPHVRVAHITINFCLWRQRRYRIHHDEVDRV